MYDFVLLLHFTALRVFSEVFPHFFGSTLYQTAAGKADIICSFIIE